MKSLRDGTQQYGALPWRRISTGVEILLLTSRDTRRWVIPKGWPMVDCDPAKCAALEAYEEAGVEGQVGALVGDYVYDKRLKDGSLRALVVHIYPLEVTTEFPAWPESGERERQWFAASAAADAVDEPELSDLIRAFSAAFAPPRT